MKTAYRLLSTKRLISFFLGCLISPSLFASPYMFFLEFNKEATPPTSVTKILTGKYPHPKINKPTRYSYSPDSLREMEKALRVLTATKIIKTPPVSHKTASSPTIIRDEISPTSFFQSFIESALKRTEAKVKYDGQYRYINYPNGDVPKNRGVCTDVVIRSYRSLGIDLQQLVHEDMTVSFSRYPSRNKWGLTKPDPNIDHRRVYNLQTFFQRFGDTLAITKSAKDYKPGDMVTWSLGPKMPHIGIVIDEYSESDSERPLIVHNMGQGPKKEDILFSFPITGHYRYKPGRTEAKHTPIQPKLTLRKRQRKKHLKTSLKKQEKRDTLLEDAIQTLLLPN